MEIIDVSVLLREGMPGYPGDEPFRRELARGEDGPGELSSLHMSAHCGTHVDAPAHMLAGGVSVDRLQPSVLMGPAEVVPVSDPQSIKRAELERYGWEGVERVLFKTANSGLLNGRRGFVEDYVYLERGAAGLLAERGVRLVGVDYLSVDPPAGGMPAHRLLLEAGVVVLEGLDLARAAPGSYTMFCGPLKVAGGDGAPARVFLARSLRPACRRAPKP